MRIAVIVWQSSNDVLCQAGIQVHVASMVIKHCHMNAWQLLMHCTYIMKLSLGQRVVAVAHDRVAHDEHLPADHEHTAAQLQLLRQLYMHVCLVK